MDAMALGTGCLGNVLISKHGVLEQQQRTPVDPSGRKKRLPKCGGWSAHDGKEAASPQWNKRINDDTEEDGPLP